MGSRQPIVCFRHRGRPSREALQRHEPIVALGLLVEAILTAVERRVLGRTQHAVEVRLTASAR